MAYTNYEFYEAAYHGNAVPEDAFYRLAERASERIDALTGGQAALASGAAEEAVQRCCCALAEILYTREQAPAGAQSGTVLKSETVGSWKRDYELTADAAKTLDAQIYDRAEQYLGPWGLLFRGVRPCVH